MKVMGVDPGLRAGWSSFAPRRAPLSGSNAIAKDASNLGALIFDYGVWLSGLIQAHEPDVLAIAKPFISRKATPDALLPLFALIGKSFEVAHTLHVRPHPVYEPAARRALCGNLPRDSAEIKKAVVRACRSLHWRVTDHHAADALCVGAYARAQINPRLALQVTPLFRKAG